MTLTAAESITLLSALLGLLLASQLLGGLFQRLHQPRVVGEILGGALLGPMVLGQLWPAAYAAIFPATTTHQKVLGFVFWLGSLLLMYCAGLEAHSFAARRDWRLVGWLTAIGTLLPMGFGWWLSRVVDFQAFYGPNATPTSFGLVLGMAITITAIPVLSKIFLDLRLAESRFAHVVLTVAFVEDVLLWAVLAVTLGLGQHAGADAWHLGINVLLTLGFFALSSPPASRALDQLATSRWNPLRGAAEGLGQMALLLAFVLLAYALGVNALFAAFVAGRLVAGAHSVSEERREQVRAFSFALFVPVFFASVGLKVVLNGGFDVGAFLSLLALAVVVKTLATLAGGRLAGRPWNQSLHLAVALNARGALGIVLATIALEAALITPGFYAILVLVALVTSQFAGWWLQRLQRKAPEQFELP